MSPAALSLVALLVALALSMSSRINVGWLALAFAWLIGVYQAGMRPEAVMAGFPVSLFLTLSGVTLLFAIADTNGTLAVLAHRAIALARGNARVIPLLFFVVACALCSVGPGAISTVALLAPLAMAVGQRVGVTPFLTALMVANGANAGNLSPFSSVGIIANGAMAKSGLVGHETLVWFANFAAHVIVAGVAYLWLIRRPNVPESAPEPNTAAAPVASFSPQQTLTLLVIAAWILGVVALNLSLGLSAFAASALLLVARTADDGEAVRGVPWGIIMMVCGVSVLVAVTRKDWRHGSLHVAPGAPGITSLDQRGDCLRDGRNLDLQQHLGRRPAGVSADDSEPRRAARRWRSACHCPVNQRRLVARRHLAALDHRRAGRRGGCRRAAVARALPSADDLGPVDDDRRSDPVPALCRRAGAGTMTEGPRWRPVLFTRDLEVRRNQADGV